MREYASTLSKAKKILQEEIEKKKNSKLTFADILPELRKKLSAQEIRLLERGARIKARGFIIPGQAEAMALTEKGLSAGGKIGKITPEKVKTLKIMPQIKKIRPEKVILPLSTTALLLGKKTKEIRRPIRGPFFTRFKKRGRK